MDGKEGMELGKPSLTLRSPIVQTGRTREELLYKGTKAEEVSRVADETVVLEMFCESRTEGRVSAETQQPKERRGVYCESYQT
jgi:hypothetical protein